MKHIIIGYQGIENSNNHLAAKMMAMELDFDSLELRPLLSSENVVNALKRGEIDYGVMAFSTDVAGDVMESKKAREGLSYEVLSSVSFDIHHCLFKKDESVKDQEIRFIRSHPEALRECEHNVKSLYPDAEFIPAEDTAFAAKSLKDGTFTADTAVLCSQKAGEENNLCLIQKNIEDLEHNGTTFSMISIK